MRYFPGLELLVCLLALFIFVTKCPVVTQPTAV